MRLKQQDKYDNDLTNLLTDMLTNMIKDEDLKDEKELLEAIDRLLVGVKYITFEYEMAIPAPYIILNIPFEVKLMLSVISDEIKELLIVQREINNTISKLISEADINDFVEDLYSVKGMETEDKVPSVLPIKLNINIMSYIKSFFESILMDDEDDYKNHNYYNFSYYEVLLMAVCGSIFNIVLECVSSDEELRLNYLSTSKKMMKGINIVEEEYNNIEENDKNENIFIS